MQRRLWARTGSGKEPAGERRRRVNRDKRFFKRQAPTGTDKWLYTRLCQRTDKERDRRPQESKSKQAPADSQLRSPRRPGRWRALSCRRSWRYMATRLISTPGWGWRPKSHKKYAPPARWGRVGRGRDRGQRSSSWDLADPAPCRSPGASITQAGWQAAHTGVT